MPASIFFLCAWNPKCLCTVPIGLAWEFVSNVRFRKVLWDLLVCVLSALYSFWLMLTFDEVGHIQSTALRQQWAEAQWQTQLPGWCDHWPSPEHDQASSMPGRGWKAYMGIQGWVWGMESQSRGSRGESFLLGSLVSASPTTVEIQRLSKSRIHAVVFSSGSLRAPRAESTNSLPYWSQNPRC